MTQPQNPLQYVLLPSRRFGLGWFPGPIYSVTCDFTQDTIATTRICCNIDCKTMEVLLVHVTRQQPS
jgi:hypothetical protein